MSQISDSLPHSIRSRTTGWTKNLATVGQKAQELKSAQNRRAITAGKEGFEYKEGRNHVTHNAQNRAELDSRYSRSNDMPCQAAKPSLCQATCMVQSFSNKSSSGNHTGNRDVNREAAFCNGPIGQAIFPPDCHEWKGSVASSDAASRRHIFNEVCAVVICSCEKRHKNN